MKQTVLPISRAKAALPADTEENANFIPEYLNLMRACRGKVAWEIFNGEGDERDDEVFSFFKDADGSAQDTFSNQNASQYQVLPLR